MERKRKNWKSLMWQLILFGVLIVLGQTTFRNVYVVEWVTRDTNRYIWVLAILFVCLGKNQMALAVTFGNIAGILIGQILGDFLYIRNRSQITADMSAEQVAHLSLHQGVFIWFSVLVFFVLVGVMFSRKKKSGITVNKGAEEQYEELLYRS